MFREFAHWCKPIDNRLQKMLKEQRSCGLQECTARTSGEPRRDLDVSRAGSVRGGEPDPRRKACIASICSTSMSTGPRQESLVPKPWKVGGEDRVCQRRASQAL